MTPSARLRASLPSPTSTTTTLERASGRAPSRGAHTRTTCSSSQATWATPTRPCASACAPSVRSFEGYFTCLATTTCGFVQRACTLTSPACSLTRSQSCSRSGKCAPSSHALAPPPCAPDLTCAHASERAREPSPSPEPEPEPRPRCDEIDVDVGPARVSTHVTIVPLDAWYSYTFDHYDPRPGTSLFDKFCKWPMHHDSVRFP